MNKCTWALVVFLVLHSRTGITQPHRQVGGRPPSAFTVIPLGVRGGLDESNLSSYLVAARGTSGYICLDAGTLYAGIRLALAQGSFPSKGLSAPTPSSILRNNILAYFISHPHLDHIAGLIINSPDDSSKNIYGLASCLNVLRDNYFSWRSWANFGDEGDKPLLKKYHYAVMEPGTEVSVEGTPLSIAAFSLSHGAPYESTAFLVRKKDAYLLYLGDTGADSVEHSDKLHRLWQIAGPLIREKKLKALFIEVSYPSEQSDKSLFGHLTPFWFLQEMKDLEGQAGAGALKGLSVVITHRKPSGHQEEKIRQQLIRNNPLLLKLIFPRQGEKMVF